MTKFKGQIECPYCSKMTEVEGKSNIRYIVGKCYICNQEFSYKIDALNGIIREKNCNPSSSSEQQQEEAEVPEVPE